MAKKKTNKSKSKPASSGGALVKQRPVGRPTVSRAALEHVCGLNDPFCPAAKLSKVPDNAGINSLNYPLHTRSALASSAAGDGAYIMLPTYTYSNKKAGDTAAGLANVAFDSATVNDLGLAPRLSGVAGYRINTWGFVLRNIVAPLSSSGMVHIRGFNEKDLSNLSGVTQTDTVGYNCDFSADIPLQDLKEVAVLGSRTGPDSVIFHAPEFLTNYGVEDWVSQGWGYITVSFSGVPASQDVIDIEFFVNYEVTFNSQESTALLMTPPPRSTPLIKEAADIVASEARSVFKDGIASVSNFMLRRAALALGSLVSARTGGMAGGALRAITVD